MIIVRKAMKAETSNMRIMILQSSLFLLTMHRCYVIVLVILTKNEEQLPHLSEMKIFFSTSLAHVFPHP